MTAVFRAMFVSCYRRDKYTLLIGHKPKGVRKKNAAVANTDYGASCVKVVEGP